MFDRLKQWINSQQGTPLPASAPSAPAPVATRSLHGGAVRAAGPGSLKEVAATFANTLLRPPSGPSDTLIAGELEHAVYNEILKLLKEGVDPDTLPKCPTTITQLLRVLGSDESGYDEVVALINQEPVLASEIIKLANSPLFRPKGGEVTCIESAARLLGMAKLSAMASTIMMKRIIEIKPIYFKYFGKYLWTHSQQCALACGYLAERAGVDYFNAYLIGLLHDIGKLVIFQELLKALRQAHPDLHPNEKIIATIVDRAAAQLSCVSLKHWELPLTIQTAVCEQARVKEPESLSAMGYILYSANALSEIWLLLREGFIDREQTEQLLKQFDLPYEVLLELFDKGE